MQMVLKLVNNVSKKEYSFDVVDNNLSQIFYNFNITLPEGTDDGEYTYRLYDGTTVLATGLLQVGDYTPQRTTYNKDKHEFIQYQPE